MAKTVSNVLLAVLAALVIIAASEAILSAIAGSTNSVISITYDEFSRIW